MDEYEKVNFDGPTRYQTIDRLERTGVDIALSIVHEINDLNVVYQSDLLLICLLSCSEQKLFVK
ncbi:hypothetical protein GCM10010967_53180 [Dyadobacter beijingensis]|uniref:Uncharacterized protein n=2 Tax=Dyadobacter beijingensis TaxID=365489 RepID=A0ABQ2IIZ8_9BACT|nr:hypothetical protein GCM10010967_53180 [Dyadobacter beijingensis]